MDIASKATKLLELHHTGTTLVLPNVWDAWSARAVAVHRLRRIGLEALLRMPPEAVPDFFETFFALPARHRHAYLSGRDDLAGHLAAMGALFGHADVRLRRRLVSPAFRRPAPALPTPR